MTAYVEWWTQRRHFQKSPNTTILAFACLILRICANSTQYLTEDLEETLESELSDSVDNLSSRYQAAAQRISDIIPPGKGGLLQVQQLFLGATWLKAEAEFAASWHMLAEAVREAQEIGNFNPQHLLDNRSFNSDMNSLIGIHFKETRHEVGQLENELRKRMWCALFVWDV